MRSSRPLSDEIFGALTEESGSHTTLWWREMDSNLWVPLRFGGAWQ